MKRARLLFGSALFLLALATPTMANAIVLPCDSVVACLPRPVPLECPTVQITEGGQSVSFNTEFCDLAVDKQVSINGGTFVEADTAPDAAQAQVGDTVTYKIKVTNNSSEGLTPHGIVYVSDVLPGGVTYVSSSATAGNYITNGFFANYWYLPLLNGDNTSNLPATLTITTTSNATGLYQNTATLAKYDINGQCDGGCPYVDANAANDSNDAWIDPQIQVTRTPPPPPPPPTTSVGSDPDLCSNLDGFQFTVPAGFTRDKQTNICTPDQPPQAPKVLSVSTTAPTPPSEPSPPQVLAASTLSNTGSSLVESLIAGLLVIATLGLAIYGRLARKPSFLDI